MDEDCVLAIDIGGSKLVMGLVTRQGRIVGKRRVDSANMGNISALLTIIEEGANALMREYPGQHPHAVGVAVPGLADSARGNWVYSPFSGIGDIPIAQHLQERLGMPVRIQNDVNACALAERAFGTCRGVDDFLWVTVSNGIGGALVLNGRLYEGYGGYAGEIGHVCVQPGGQRCGCGNHGCLEAEAAGPAITRMYRERTGTQLPADQIAQAAKAGDAQAAEVFAASGRYIGQALACAANLLNPRLVVLGGGVSMAFSLLEAGILQQLRAGLFSAANRSLRVIPTALGYWAGLMGAAQIAMEV